MKKAFHYFACLLVVCSASLAQSQPSQKKAPANASNGYWYSPTASTNGSTASSGYWYSPTENAKHPTASNGYWYSPTASTNSSITASGNWYSPTGSYYSPTASGGGQYYSPPSATYTASSDGYYTPQAGGYTTANSSYYSPPMTNYGSASGGSYYTPQTAATISQPSQNKTLQNQITPLPTTSSFMNTASVADSAKNAATSTGPNTSLTASVANAPDLTDLLIYPVEGIKMGADTAFEWYSDELGPLGGFAANGIYKDLETTFSDPNLLQKATQIQKQNDQEFQQYQSKQQNFWNDINVGFDETSSKIQNNINNVLGAQTNMISTPTH